MIIVLQHQRSGQYFKSAGAWTANLADARNFVSSPRALRYIRRHRLQGVHIVAAFLQSACIETVALRLPQPQLLAA